MPEPRANQSIETVQAAIDPTAAWGVDLEAAICEQCDWSYLLPRGSLSRPCPNCFQTRLTPLAEQTDDLPYLQPPELMLPFTITAETLTRNIQIFAGGIWFAPSDLSPKNLADRLQRVYLPMWLVDSDAQAIWQAEAGFDYEVVSHQDAYDQNRNGWVSREVTETRIRWEPRVGRLRRAYHNIAAPALEEHQQLRQKLGQYELGEAQPFRPEAISNTTVRLPNRVPADAWAEAIPSIRTSAAEECRRACQADHLREFRWSAEYANQNWTLLLLPLYTTYYLDDNQAIQPVLIHGQTGRLHGPRRASMRRAQHTALVIVIIAVVVFGLGLIAAAAGLLVPPLLILGIIGLIVALGIGLLAIAPLVIAWQFNRTTS